jgi:hypothetical protein
MSARVLEMERQQRQSRQHMRQSSRQRHTHTNNRSNLYQAHIENENDPSSRAPPTSRVENGPSRARARPTRPRPNRPRELERGPRLEDVILDNVPPPVSSLTLDVQFGDEDDDDYYDNGDHAVEVEVNANKKGSGGGGATGKLLGRDSDRTSPTTCQSSGSSEDGSNDYIDDNFHDNDDDDTHNNHDYDQLVSDTERIKYYLAKRNFHLPHNNWQQDLKMYFLNNHLIFGLFCHHPLHPLGWQERVLMLVTSLVVGLGATCAVVLVFADTNQDLTEEVVGVDYQSHHYAVTQGMIALWTYGSSVHTLFDFMVWHVFACAFCQQGAPLGEKLRCCKWVGANVGLLLCICAVGMSAGFIWQRVAYEASNNNGQFAVNMYNSGLEFCVGYFIETALALLVYTPVFALVLFTGVLGCYKLPVLGGRPADVASHEHWRKAQVKQRKKSLTKSRIRQQQQQQQRHRSHATTIYTYSSTTNHITSQADAGGRRGMEHGDTNGDADVDTDAGVELVAEI